MKVTTVCSTATIFVLLCRASCLNITFPAGFQFGAATSHVQTEGAWNVSDKSEGSWDHWLHRIPSPVMDGSNADVACDSYHKYKEDVRMLKNIGFDFYRLSISWSRLLPNGFANAISADGLRFYKNLLRELVDNGIKPIVNLHHLDHPQTIEDMGGWMNPLIVDWFADYARVVFRELGPMVDAFITINEPEFFCSFSYMGNHSAFAPGKKLGDYAEYICLHNALMAHAKAWHIYNDEFRAAQKGRIGMVQACVSYQPLNASDPDDALAVRRALDFNCGRIGDPLFVGDYPEIMKTRISVLSEMQGYAKSRLPEFTDDEIAYVRGTSDFVGLNYYQAPTVRFQTEEEARENPTDSGIFPDKLPPPKKLELADHKRIAKGLRDLLRWVRDRYNNTPVVIMENGYKDEGSLDDYDRISYFHDILSSLLSAIRADGCNVVGYSVWSLMDTFEGGRGYTEKFGLYHVDFASPNRGTNVNEPPVLEAGGYPAGLPLSEATPVGTPVFTLKGHDPENSPVKYGIQLTDKFAVDPKTGIITLAKPLDREVNDTVRFRVTLEDEVPEGQQPNIVGVDAYVIVLDENDNAPRFLGIPYEAVAAEDTPPGSTILPGIRLTDPDLLGDNIEVSCVPQTQFPDACEKFAIVDVEKSEKNYVGALVLRKPLDYRERPFYQLLLTARDGKNNSTTGVEIKVADIQNSPPEFLDSLTGVVQEDDPIGTLVMTVKARDGDRGMPRKVVYQLVTDPFDYFLLDSDTGELRTAKPLDREALADSTGVLTLKVRASEVIDGVPGNDNLTVSTAEATVTIKDVNDEPPSFNRREYNIEIPENVPNGTPLPHLDMTVTDPDVGINSVFSLRLEDITGAFTVEPSMATGSTAVNIRVTNGSLDYENPNQRKFIILVIAEEVHTDPKLASTATVTVSITDANDNAPSFNSPTYTALVSETAIPGTPITTITAKDRDSGQFGTAGIVYQLLGQGAEHFTVDNKTGSITVAMCPTPGTAPCLDYETQTEYFLTYKATDDNGRGQTTSVSLRVGLTDANDNPPQFLQQRYRAVVDEGAEKFEPELKVQARDKDKTSRITYSIVSGDDSELFAIDPNTGQIEIANGGPLDVTNATHEWIALAVQASDSTFTDTAVVNVTVRDVNNNAPQFAQDLYTDSIPEITPIGTVVDEMEATDADSGVNAELIYRIQKGAFDDFSIDGTTGVVTVSNKLDFDTRNTYHIEIIAFDKGTPSLTGTTTLMINVENSNDKPPRFVPETQRTEVTEDTAIGTVFFALKAVDPDSNDPEALNFAISEPITAIDRNGQQVLENMTFKDFFAVDKKTGQVSVVRSLDRDIAATVSLTVVATDTTAPTLQQGRGTLVITVIDVNHLAPEFARPWTRENPRYNIEMQEEQPTGAIVGAFTATDADSNIAGYSIEPPSSYFVIDNATGIVRTTQVIDYEETKQLTFTVIAHDSGVPPLSASAEVTVAIVNVNDQDPKFEKEAYTASIKENSPPGTHVAVVKATDGDEGTFGEIRYSLISDHASDFNIGSETGEITVGSATVLDREMTPEITITVMASDGAPPNTRRSTSVPVHIKLIDVNDNRPIFSQHSYVASVAENLSVNPPTTILQVWTTDADEGENGEVRYSIINGNDNDSFVLNPKTGILYPAASLLGRAGTYQIEVEAKDGAGKGPHSDRCLIDIRVLPVNQHKPEFIMPELPNATVEVPENAGVPNYLVMTVKASDRDPGENGRVSYHLKIFNKNVQETEEFAIDRETGELRAKIILDREVRNKFELVLVAADHGSPTAYETLRLLTILLVDTNDNVPEFSEANDYSFQIPENRPKDYLVGRVVADDKDEGRHARVYYYILSGNDEGSFYVDKSDGSIFSNRSFDREKRDEYSLSILAANDPDIWVGPRETVRLANDPAYGHANVTVRILDENDNPPVFERTDYYAGINAKSVINDFVANVTASDPDLGENGTLFYYVASANLYKFGSERSSGSIVPSPFNVTQDGRVVTTGYMAEYNQDRFVVEVIAKETTPPERYARTQVHIWVFEQAQLIRVILSRPPEEVNRAKDEIVAQLSNATQSRVVVDDIKYHVDASDHIRREWCDMYLHVVDTSTQAIAPIPEVLKVIDAKYDQLQDYYAGFAIENVVPAYVGMQEETFNPALAALIALLVVLLVGAVTVVVVCCCLRHWVIAVPNDLRKKDALIKKQIIDELNTTENPLWIEQKLKLYEEQELTMQVFSEPEAGIGTERRGSGVSVGMGDTSQDNTYATIQHPLPPNRHRPTTPDYTTLPGNHNLYESAMGFQGSTFQPTQTTQLTLDRDGQPQFVSGLI